MEKREVFISYHTDSSADSVRKICAALEAAGVSCWYAPRDVRGRYARAIEDAIDQCQVFLLLLNENSNISEHVLNEVDSAFDRLNRDEDIELLPFLLGQCELGPDMRYYIRRIHIMDGTNPPSELRLQELVDRICLRLGKNPEKTLLVQEGTAQAETQYRITGAMVYPDTRFVGRRAELDAIRNQLSDVQNKLALVGMGGIGKSEIAKMYLKENAGDYDVILWVSFTGSLQQTIASDALFPIQGLSCTDYPEDSERAYFERKLQLLKRIADRRVLIVMDNFDVTEDPDLEAFCGGSYGVLFTTRYHQDHSALPEVEVCGMRAEEDLLALFRAEYLRPLDEKGLGKVKEILALLEGHPLSIRLVASAMQKNRRLSPEQMLERLRTGAASMEKQGVKGNDTIGGYLRQVFQLSTLTEDEQYLLKNLALISLRGVEVGQFFDWCGAEDFDVIDGLIHKSWVIHDPVTDKVHLHPMVADLMAQELEKDPGCCEKLVQSLHQACRVDISYSWEQKVALNDFASTLYDRLPKSHPMRYLALDAKARLTMSMAWYEKSAYMFLELLPLMDTPEQKMEIYNKAAHSFVLGRLGEEGRSTAAEGLALVKETWPEKPHLKPGSYYRELLCRMTEAYVLLGDYDTAVEYGRKALSLCGEIEAAGLYSNQGWVEYHLARALCYTGQYDEAERIISHAIALFEGKGDLWSLNYANDIRGMVLTKQGKFTEALELNRRSYDILLPHYGTEHADIGQNLEYRGSIYKAMGQREKAAGCFRQAIDIYTKRGCYRRVEEVQKMMQD